MKGAWEKQKSGKPTVEAWDKAHVMWSVRETCNVLVRLFCHYVATFGEEKDKKNNPTFQAWDKAHLIRSVRDTCNVSVRMFCDLVGLNACNLVVLTHIAKSGGFNCLHSVLHCRNLGPKRSGSHSLMVLGPAIAKAGTSLIERFSMSGMHGTILKRNSCFS